VPIERHRQRFEIALWWGLTQMGLGPFDAARRALLATKGGPIQLEDVEGVLVLTSAEIPLPPPDRESPTRACAGSPPRRNALSRHRGFSPVPD
jgi:hypothetical protein